MDGEVVTTTPLLGRDGAPNDGTTVAPMRLLASGVPLTLLLDLFSPIGPDSRHLYRAESSPAR